MPEWLIGLIVVSGAGVAVTVLVSIVNKYMPRERATALGIAHGIIEARAIHKIMKSTKYLNDKSIEMIEEGPIDTASAYIAANVASFQNQLDLQRTNDGIKPTVDIMGDTKLDSPVAK